MFKTSALLLAMTVWVIILMPNTARGSDPNWSNKAFSYYANNQDIADIMRDFASSVNTPIIVSKAVEGKATGSFFSSSPKAFLEEISDRYDLVWYYDGVTLYVYDDSENLTRIIESKGEDIPEMLDKLERNPVYDSRFGIALAKDGEGLVITGPPRYVGLLVASIKAPGMDNQIVSKIFELKHAWATDKTFYYRDRSFTVPGVATLMQRLFQGETSDGSSQNSTSDSQNLAARAGLQPARGALPPNQSPASNQPQGGSRLENSRHISLASYITRFQADMRINAVMVHDFATRMPMYEKLIKRLDVVTGLVEIKAAILDVDSSALDELGFGWRLQDGKFNIGYGDVSNTGLDAGTAIALAKGAGDFSTVLPMSASYIVSRIQAVAQKGRTKILARPSVLTTDNMQALLDLHETFHVKVAGQYSTNLYPVTTGTLLRVTPHIVQDGHGKGIKLAINIEDGEITQNDVDGIPVVKKNTINTQAIVRENQSLLIGGYHYETEEDNTKKIPLLGDIPLLGFFFKSDKKQKVKNERIYIISPRIVNPDELALVPRAEHYMRESGLGVSSLEPAQESSTTDSKPVPKNNHHPRSTHLPFGG